jgi:hypothetical protein
MKNIELKCNGGILILHVKECQNLDTISRRLQMGEPPEDTRLPIVLLLPADQDWSYIDRMGRLYRKGDK